SVNATEPRTDVQREEFLSIQNQLVHSISKNWFNSHTLVFIQLGYK
ncbi:MAG: hypothetical protein ACI9EQ_002128, partial [Bacteroidia bacterium]